MQHSLMPPRARVRRHTTDDIYGMEDALRRHGFARIAGADEAGRGACAGPLVVAAVVLPPGRRGRIAGLTDSKLLTEAHREEIYAAVVERAEAHTVVSIPAEDVDRYGLGVCNLTGMRRAFARLWPAPGYVLTDGFPVPGLRMPGLGVWKGDRVAGCIAAASVLAKVTRDRHLVELDAKYPQYGFAEHKGYSTPAHQAALARYGPCAEHRRSYANVAAAGAGAGGADDAAGADGLPAVGTGPVPVDLVP